MSSESVDEDNLHISNAGSNGQFLSKESGNAGGLTWASAGADLSPSCFVIPTSNQNISHNTVTALQLATEIFDTGGAYNTSTYRFTPQTAGKYVVGVGVVLSMNDTNIMSATILKNGSTQEYKQWAHCGTNNENTAMVVAIVNMNGSSDYLQAACDHNKGSTITLNASFTNSIFFWAFRLPGV